MAYRSARTERAKRLANLERLIQPRKAGGRTLDDVCAEHALSEGEMQRLARWLHERDQGEPPDEQQALEAEARWANCRFTHGPGLCKENCSGEFREDHENVVEGAPGEPEAASERGAVRLRFGRSDEPS
jgi:hypothetical protein